MTRLRRPLLALVALFTLAISIDRIGVTHGSDAIGSHVYALAALAVAAPLAFSGLRRSRPWLPGALAVAAYAAIRLSVDTIDGNVHVVTTEIAFLLLAARLGRQLAGAIAEVDETLGTIAFGTSDVVDIESRDAAEIIGAEVARSRRHDRPMTLSVLSPTARSLADALAQASHEVDRAVRRRYLHGKLARSVSEILRRSDVLMEHRASGRLYVLSPETSRDAAELLSKRLLEAAHSMHMEAVVGVAVFPDDAIGFETMVEAAHADLSARLEPASPLRAVESGTR